MKKYKLQTTEKELTLIKGALAYFGLSHEEEILQIEVLKLLIKLDSIPF